MYYVPRSFTKSRLKTPASRSEAAGLSISKGKKTWLERRVCNIEGECAAVAGASGRRAYRLFFLLITGLHTWLLLRETYGFCPKFLCT